MRELLNMSLGPNDDRRKFLKELGFEGEDATNSALLMTILFKKGCTGDVGAIKEIVEMMDKLDMVSEQKDKKEEQNIININIQPVKTKEEADQDKIEYEIMMAEREIEEDEDW